MVMMAKLTWLLVREGILIIVSVRIIMIAVKVVVAMILAKLKII